MTVAVSAYAIGFCAVFVGGCVQGATGFGFALIVVPPLMLALDARTAVPTVLILSLLNVTMTWLRYHRDASLRDVGLLAIGGVLGAPLGALILARFAGPWFNVAVGAILMALSVALLSGSGRPVGKQSLALLPVGFASGILNGSTSMGGPPAMLFLSNQGTPKELFRANLVTYFIIINIVSLVTFSAQGLITGEVLTFVGVFLPVLIIGTYVGVKAEGRISERGFRRFAVICAGLMGFLLLVRNVGQLF